MSTAADLRARAEGLAAPFPPLLAEARQLAATFLMGAHGRRRPGQGAEFWQFRAALPGDSPRGIDWRRSARSDQRFVRQFEWQAAQTVTLWVDRSAAMRFAGGTGRVTKADRAALIALALSVVLLRADERVGLLGDPVAAASGRGQIERVATALATDHASEYGAPPPGLLQRGSRAVFLSDFLGDPEPLRAAMGRAADREVRGALVQVLDPVEVAFPFDGRTIFESMGGSLRHETRRARGLRDRYGARLEARYRDLQALAGHTGWQVSRHLTDASPQAALLWLYRALERQG